MAIGKTERCQLVNFWAEQEVVRELEERAFRADRSRSAEIRIAVREHLWRDANLEDAAAAHLHLRSASTTSSEGEQ